MHPSSFHTADPVHIFLTILGLQRENDQWYLQLATWGEIRYMRLADYVQHGKFSFPFTNTIYETRIIQK